MKILSNTFSLQKQGVNFVEQIQPFATQSLHLMTLTDIAFEASREKREILVTSIFSFSHSIFFLLAIFDLSCANTLNLVW